MLMCICIFNGCAPFHAMLIFLNKEFEDGFKLRPNSKLLNGFEREKKILRLILPGIGGIKISQGSRIGQLPTVLIQSKADANNSPLRENHTLILAKPNVVVLPLCPLIYRTHTTTQNNLTLSYQQPSPPPSSRDRHAGPTQKNIYIAFCIIVIYGTNLLPVH